MGAAKENQGVATTRVPCLSGVDLSGLDTRYISVSDEYPDKRKLRGKGLIWFTLQVTAYR